MFHSFCRKEYKKIEFLMKVSIPIVLVPMFKKQAAPLVKYEGSSDKGMFFMFNKTGKKRIVKSAYKGKTCIVITKMHSMMINLTHAIFRFGSSIAISCCNSGRSPCVINIFETSNNYL